MPDRAAMRYDLARVYSLEEASDRPTERPSGIFWRPIAIMRAMAEASFPDPNPTPTANPSGMLWIVIARTKSQTALSLDLLPSTPILMKCIWGMSLSM